MIVLEDIQAKEVDSDLRRKQLFSEKRKLSAEFAELQVKVKEIKDSRRGRGGPYVSGLERAIIDDRESYVKRMMEIMARLSQIKEELADTPKQRYRGDLQQYPVFKEILGELFSKEQMSILWHEVNRRVDGLPPAKIPLSLIVNGKKKAEQINYKELAQELMATVISARKNLTDVIRDGCSKYGNAEFLTLVSPANKSLPPIQELEKLKRINHLK